MFRYRHVSLTALGLMLLALHAPEVLAQVSGSAKVTSFFSWILSLVQVAGYSLFTIALVTLGYKVAYVEGFKISDGKGIVIGGLIFGLAATIATFFTTQ
jgi:hypothetical protein